MEIVDITNILTEQQEQTTHNFKFNPSIQISESGLALISFRNIYFNVSDGNSYQPFQIWWDPTILQRKHLNQKSPNIDNEQLQLILNNRYRTSLNIQEQTIDWQNQQSQYYHMFDGTGVFICEIYMKESEIQLIPLIMINDVFNGEFNQDARIYLKNVNKQFDQESGKQKYNQVQLQLTYNTFWQKEIQMTSRIINIDLQNGCHTLEQESSLLFDAQLVEKNCVVFNDQYVLYSINGVFVIQDVISKCVIKKPIPQIQNIINQYGSDVIMFSLGTQSVKYGSNFLMCGHLKVRHRSLTHVNTNFARFITGQKNKFRDINQYIYFMYFIEFSEQFEVVSISNALIPTSASFGQFPYLLCFPSGLCEFNDSYFVSYGEADIKSKLMIIQKQELHKIMIPIAHVDEQTFKFQFFISPFEQIPTNKTLWKSPKELSLQEMNSTNINLTFDQTEEVGIQPINNIGQYTPLILEPQGLGQVINRNKKEILHYGYFKQYNCGDDAFILCFDYLQKRYYQQVNIKFTNNIKSHINQQTSMLILGGGDVINEYFVNPIIEYNKNIFQKKLDKNPESPITTIAIGVGTPYQSLFYLTQNFNTIVTRNKHDIERLNNYLDQSSSESVCEQLLYSPDLVFLFKDILAHAKSNGWNPQFIRTTPLGNSKYIGISLPKTYISDNYPHEQKNILSKISQVVVDLMCQGFVVCLIPLCINENNTKENDELLNQLISKQIQQQIDSDIDKQTLKLKGSLQIFQFKDYMNADTEFIKYIQLEKQNLDYCFEIANIISNMDIMICGRFHSHIFAILFQIPFISLTTTRKCIELMTQYELSPYLIQFDTNEIGIPVDLNPYQVMNKLLYLQLNDQEIRKQMETINREIGKNINDLQKWLVQLMLNPRQSITPY